MTPEKISRGHWLRFALLGAASTTVGCVGTWSQLGWIVKGGKTPAECSALEGRRVATVVVGGVGFRRQDDTLERMNRVVSSLLSVNVPKIDVIAPEFVARWRDDNRWDEVDYTALGRGVDAEAVLAIDVFSFTTSESATTLRGRASWKATAYDLSGVGAADAGAIVFRKGPIESRFPEHGASPDSENEERFRSQFVEKLAATIAGHFYGQDYVEQVATG